jgi:hypothetical protein
MIKAIDLPWNIYYKDFRSTQIVKNTLRKYHRSIATIFCVPLFFTAITGIGAAVADTWLHQEDLATWLIALHNGQILKLAAILPIMNGLGLIGLLATGITMTGLFSKRHPSKRLGERP